MAGGPLAHRRLLPGVLVLLQGVERRHGGRGAVAQGVGTTLREILSTDSAGHCRTPDLRTYLIPHYGEVPPPEVHFVPPEDPSRAAPKPMSELPFTPVAPALANAVRDATGIRFTSLPLRPDTVWRALDSADRRDRIRTSGA